MEIDSQKILQRKQCPYDISDDPYKVQKETYKGQQYSHIYFARFHLMRTILCSLVSEWKPHLPVCTVLGLREGKECVIVGSLYMHMKLKPIILDEYSKERSATPVVKPLNFMHPDDHLILEDESGRVKFSRPVLIPSIYVTGLYRIMKLNGTMVFLAIEASRNCMKF